MLVDTEPHAPMVVREDRFRRAARAAEANRCQPFGASRNALPVMAAQRLRCIPFVEQRAITAAAREKAQARSRYASKER